MGGLHPQLLQILWLLHAGRSSRRSASVATPRGGTRRRPPMPLIWSSFRTTSRPCSSEPRTSPTSVCVWGSVEPKNVQVRLSTIWWFVTHDFGGFWWHRQRRGNSVQNQIVQGWRIPCLNIWLWSIKLCLQITKRNLKRLFKKASTNEKNVSENPVMAKIPNFLPWKPQLKKIRISQEFPRFERLFRQKKPYTNNHFQLTLCITTVCGFFTFLPSNQNNLTIVFFCFIANLFCHRHHRNSIVHCWRCPVTSLISKESLFCNRRVFFYSGYKCSPDDECPTDFCEPHSVLTLFDFFQQKNNRVVCIGGMLYECFNEWMSSLVGIVRMSAEGQAYVVSMDCKKKVFNIFVPEYALDHAVTPADVEVQPWVCGVWYFPISTPKRRENGSNTICGEKKYLKVMIFCFKFFCFGVYHWLYKVCGDTHRIAHRWTVCSVGFCFSEKLNPCVDPKIRFI